MAICFRNQNGMRLARKRYYTSILTAIQLIIFPQFLACFAMTKASERQAYKTDSSSEIFFCKGMSRKVAKSDILFFMRIDLISSRDMSAKERKTYGRK
jgi:uncharacterized DUF497 family protein